LAMVYMIVLEVLVALEIKLQNTEEIY
jgi:hypothetical protein